MNSDTTTARIIKACKAGVKIQAITSKVEDISDYRMRSVINPSKYKGATKFTDREVREINKVLDDVMEALKWEILNLEFTAQ